MPAWIQQAVSTGPPGAAALPAAFLLGLLAAATSCCALPALGVVVGYAGTMEGSRDRREILVAALALMLGMTASLAALGALTGLFGRLAGSSLGRYWQFGAGLLLVAFGLSAAGFAPFRPPRIALGGRARRRGLPAALAYGLAVGGASTACSAGCNPLLGLVAGATMLKGATLLGAAVFALFALGYSLPLAAGLVGIGMGLGRLGQAVRRAAPLIRAGSGLLLIGVGFYLLASLR